MLKTLPIYVLLWGILPLLGYGADWEPNRPPWATDYPPPDPYTWRPYTPNHSRGMMPGNDYNYVPPQTASFSPRLELELSERQPYVQQNIMLILRVISSGPLDKLEPDFAANQGLNVQPLTRPTAAMRWRNGTRQIVNEVRYLVTPLVAGTWEVAASVLIEAAGATNQTLKMAQPPQLTVRPPPVDATPWLPLQQLTLTSNRDTPSEVEAGKPLMLILKLAATGATGAQLPSLERLLQAPDFRVYREKTEIDGGVSGDGRHIFGTRTEHYTLVPQYGGALRLPAARLPWFNVTTGTLEHVSLPIQILTASGQRGGAARFFLQGDTRSLFPSGDARAFWMPLAGIFLLLSGYWLGVWYRQRTPWRVIPRLRESLHRGGEKLGRTFRRFGTAFVKRFTMHIPLAWRFWWWVRAVNREHTPDIWRKQLQHRSKQALGLSAHAPLPRFADRLASVHAGRHAQQVQDLLHTLERALYGRHALDFARWKHAFTRAIRPQRWRLLSAWRHHRPPGLPPLNPMSE